MRFRHRLWEPDRGAMDGDRVRYFFFQILIMNWMELVRTLARPSELEHVEGMPRDSTRAWFALQTRDSKLLETLRKKVIRIIRITFDQVDFYPKRFQKINRWKYMDPDKSRPTCYPRPWICSPILPGGPHITALIHQPSLEAKGIACHAGPPRFEGLRQEGVEENSDGELIQERYPMIERKCVLQDIFHWRPCALTRSESVQAQDFWV